MTEQSYDQLYTAELAKQVAEAEAAEAQERAHKSTALVADEADRIRELAEQAVERDDELADTLIGRQIGPWRVIDKKERHATPSGKRAVYVIQHRDGFIKGVRGYRLNALMSEARNGGLA